MGLSSSVLLELKLKLRYEHFAFRLKSSFSPVAKTASDGKQSVLTLINKTKYFRLRRYDEV